MTHPPRFDAGLQPERTALAWRRTALSLVLGSLISLRILPPVLGTWSIALGFVGLALSIVLWLRATRHNHRTALALYEGQTLPDGTLPLQLGLTVSVAGLLALTYLLATFLLS
jgi:uncharacterized membrane protein YidH (DUF202 family)